VPWSTSVAVNSIVLKVFRERRIRVSVGPGD
jgi:hypothetical protein